MICRTERWGGEKAGVEDGEGGAGKGRNEVFSAHSPSK